MSLKTGFSIYLPKLIECCLYFYLYFTKRKEIIDVKYLNNQCSLSFSHIFLINKNMVKMNFGSFYTDLWSEIKNKRLCY